jgi:hypothetical protein
LVAVGLEVGDDTVSVVVGGVAEVALTGNSVVSLVSSTGLAFSVDKEEPGVAVALTVFLISILSAVLVGRASTVDDRETGVAEAATTSVGGVGCFGLGVEWAVVDGGAFAVDKLCAVVALAASVDVGLSGGADRVAESIYFLVSGFAETGSAVGIEVESWRTGGADTVDKVVLR